MRAAILAAAVAAMAAACPAMAQVPPEIAAKVKASAGQIDLTVGALYAPLLPKEPWAGIDVTVSQLSWYCAPARWSDAYRYSS